MIIAMDGPAGAGKSTVARQVAEALGLTFLDTGAMYRAVTLLVLQRGHAPDDADACTAAARAAALDFDAQGRVLIDGTPGEPDIRGPEVNRAVSYVARHPEVRAIVVARQREIADRPPGVVAEGRDVTTVVFPNADHKLFLTASAAERARRRAAQEGRPDEVAAIRAEIEERDRIDSTREHSPLLRTPDQTAIDTDGLDAAQVVEQIVRLVHGVSEEAGAPEPQGSSEPEGASEETA